MKQDTSMFWIYENGRYILLKKDSDGKMYEYRQLPRFLISFEQDLKDKGICYSVVDGIFCEVHDPDCVEYESYTSLLIDKRSPFYTDYTGYIPTKKMVQAAESYAEYVNEVLYERDLERRSTEFNTFFLQNSNDGISLYCETGILTAEELITNKDYYLIAFRKYDHFFKGLVIHKPSARGKVFTVKIPKDFIALLIGAKGRHIAEVTKRLGAKHIIIETLK